MSELSLGLVEDADAFLVMSIATAWTVFLADAA
jgi:hypothetical protein